MKAVDNHFMFILLSLDHLVVTLAVFFTHTHTHIYILSFEI